MRSSIAAFHFSQCALWLFEIAPADEVITRRFRLDSLRHYEAGLFDPLRDRLAAAEKKKTNENQEGGSHPAPYKNAPRALNSLLHHLPKLVTLGPSK